MKRTNGLGKISINWATMEIGNNLRIPLFLEQDDNLIQYVLYTHEKKD